MPLGTFMYAKMPFGIMNVEEIFQREMDIAFAKETDKFVLTLYMDDIKLFSKYDRDHMKHLEQVFLKCKKIVVSLNPRKSNFVMKEGKLLGHIISKDGIKIDPNRVKEILKVDLPRNKK